MTDARRMSIAVSMGEPAGIGGEIALKTWRRRHDGAAGEGGAPFFLIDDPARLAAISAALGLDVPIRVVEAPEDAAALFPTALPVIANPLAVPAVPGQPDPANGAAVIAAIERGAVWAREGRATALVTNPIHKDTLNRAGFAFPGHTEFLGALADLPAHGPGPVMMLVCPGLRAVPVTVHLGLADACAALSTEAIISHARVVATALVRDFGIPQPRLAVAALNPHAGENGRMGREESTIIAPAVTRIAAAGIAVTGPTPADTLFHADARRRYDAVICMYHDQALIPLKTIDFAHGVNITLGLPFVRTSPDHGTALTIAGQGCADEASLIRALDIAAEIAARRAHSGDRDHAD